MPQACAAAGAAVEPARGPASPEMRRPWAGVVPQWHPMRKLRDVLEDFGQMILFAGETFAWAFRPPFRPNLVLAQMAFVGVGSAFIVGVTGTFSGMVLALQMNVALRQFAAEGFVGGSVGFSLARELAPVFTALMIIGRSGSAIASELGTMRVTEQMDAMESMAVSPIQYLVLPRVIASILMFPLLTMLFNVLGYGGAFLMGVFVARIPIAPFIAHTQEFVDDGDVLHGLLKAVIFGLIVSIITTWRGYAASGGSRGVGEGTTRAVVASSIAILLADYAITFISVGV
jgi:phospholipid/cholesterol/gamma-HCH transport system permease protein